MGCGGSQSLPNRILYQAPSSSTYEEWSFKGELVWVPVAQYSALIGTAKETSAASASPTQAGEDYSFPCRVIRSPGSQHLVVYFHRNAEDLGTCKRFCECLRDSLRVHVLAAEFPGYGLCDNIGASASQLVRHAFAAVSFASQALRVPFYRQIVFGYCLGAAAAAAVAAEVEGLAGLAMVAPFLSTKDMFRAHVGAVAGLFSVELPIGNFAASVRCPTLIFHGKRDKMVPLTHSQQILEKLRGEKILVSPDEAGHHTSLTQDESYFLRPFADFFSLPGTGADVLDIPPWALERRRPSPDPLPVPPTAAVPPAVAPLSSKAPAAEADQTGPDGDGVACL